MSRDEPILIRSFPDLISADMALTALAAASIEANLLADDLGGALPAMHPVRGVKLYVSAENEAAARAVLDAIDSAPPIDTLPTDETADHEGEQDPTED